MLQSPAHPKSVERLMPADVQKLAWQNDCTTAVLMYSVAHLLARLQAAADPA